MEMNRRQFMQTVATASVAAGAALASTSVALADETAPETALVNAKYPDDTIHTQMPEPTDGKYVTRAMGHENYLYVETVVAGGAIASCRVLRNDETRGIGTWACTHFPARIVETQNLDVDCMSGATITCMAIKNAVAEGLTNAGYDVDAFHGGEVALPAGEDHVEDVDVVIMGAGTSGLVSAVRLLEKGFNVRIFEKDSIPGGSMPMTYSGLAAAESELQKNFGLGHYAGSPFYELEPLMDFYKKFYGIDGDLAYDRALYETSGKLVDWLHSIGVGFHTMGVSSAYDITPYLAPGCYMGGCGQAMEFLVDRINKLGGTIVYDTKVTDLVQDETGRITGLKAEGKDGSTWDVTAKAVCLASGGFGANYELIEKYYPGYEKFFWNVCPGSTGEGMVMAQNHGAAIECMGRKLGSFLSTTPQAGSFFEIAFIYQSAPGIMVNGTGKQFGNIMSDNHGTMTDGLMNPDNGGRFFHITDESGAVGLMKDPAYDFETYRALFDRGDAVHYESVEQAAEMLDLPDLPAEIEKHNALALAGEPDEFGRKNLPYLDTRDGIWVVSCMPTPYLTTGGLAIDPQCHVLTEDRAAIAGLYAAGDVCGSVEEKDGKPYGMGFDAAMNYGYIMGETVAAELA